MHKMGKTGTVRRVPASKKYRAALDKPLCKYMHRHCLRPRLDGYDYCISHILLDEDAPFRQCTFIHPVNQRRCSNAAPRNEKRESLCPWHLKQAQLAKIPHPPLPVVSKRKNETSVQLLLSLFERYCQDEMHDPNYDPDHELAMRMKWLREEPIVDQTDNIQYTGSSLEDKKTQVSETWLGQSDESESEIDESDTDEPLKHAGVYTYEEVIRIYYEKLVQLHSKYMEEFKLLQYFLRERRRDYLLRSKNEKRMPCSGVSKPVGKEEKKMKEELKALLKYHKHSGSEALLRKKFLQKKQALLEGKLKQAHAKRNVCAFSESGNRCTNDAVVLSNYCTDHIVMDSKQVLFKYCPGNGGDCRKTVFSHEEDARCIVHTQNPPQVSSSSSEKTMLTKIKDGRSKLFYEVEHPFAPSIFSRPASSFSSGNTETFPCEKEEVEHFQAMDDIASLGLDEITPGSLFGLNQFGEPGESTDSATSNDGSHFFSSERF